MMDFSRLWDENWNTPGTSAADNEDFWFRCSDQVRGGRVPFYDESYSKRIDSFLGGENTTDHPIDSESGLCNLFDFNFDRGTALIDELDDLFRMARYFYTQMEYAAQISYTVSRKNNDCVRYRRGIVGFLLWLRSCVRCFSSSSRFRSLRESHLKKISEELGSFIAFCGPTSSFLDAGHSRINEPSYHVFHCHLDVKWLHITLLHELNSDPHETLELVLSNVVADLVYGTLKRFRLISLQDLSTRTIFTCPCVKELWRLLQIKCDELNSEQRCAPFWSLVNRVCEEIIAQNDGSSAMNGGEYRLATEHNCSNPAVFIFWLLKDLNHIYEVDGYGRMKSNYHLLDSSLRLFLRADASELELRTVLLLVENILRRNWDERTEPLAVLWEYFHKRMNSSFLVPGAPISEIAIIGKSALGILRNLRRKLESEGCEEYMDSFHLFLRLLGMKLKKWQKDADGLRCWNQLKGRLLSKFSSAKFSTFNETGLYHSILIFLTMAVSVDSDEMGEKLLMFLQLLRSQELNETRTKLTLQAHTALILLFLERDRDVTSMCNTLPAMLENVQNHPQKLKFMRIFIGEFHDLLDRTDNLQLGQHTLIGNWMFQFLSSNCTESDRSRLLDCIVLLIAKLNLNLGTQLPVRQDCQLVLYGDALWKHLVPYLKTDCFSTSSPDQVADIAAALVTYFLNSTILPTNKNKAMDLFTLFTTRENVNIKLLCRFVGQMCQSKCIYNRNAFGNNDIILIRSWLRCLILLPKNEISEDLSRFTIYINSVSEMRHILSGTLSDTSLNVNGYFEAFLNSLQSLYSSLENFQSKSKLINQISSYFVNVDRWFAVPLKSPNPAPMTLNIYENVGRMFIKIPHVLYTKSKSNTLLQNFLDVLLLSNELRNPQNDVPMPVGAAINKTIHLYVRGLITLDPENDAYIERSIRELIVTHIPRLVTTRGTILPQITETSLSKCFENSSYFEVASKAILEVLCNTFLRKRAKTPHPSALSALAFLESVVKQYQNDDRVVISFTANVFDRVCDVVMFCEVSNPCRVKARNIIHVILKSNFARYNPSVSHAIIDAFGKICREYLAFTSRNLFDLFEDIAHISPDLVSQFLPQFTIEIKQVENKRGVGYDRALSTLEDVIEFNPDGDSPLAWFACTEPERLFTSDTTDRFVKQINCE